MTVPTSSPAVDRSGNLTGGPAALLQDLIRFDTSNPPGNERDCINYIQTLLESAGFETSVLGRSPSRPNLIARLQGQGRAAPLLLHGHVDVVPASKQEWQIPPFEATIVDGYIWGRGALDMKGGITMMLSALLRAKREGVIPPGDVILAMVSDEEAGGEFGAKYLVQNHPQLFEGVRYALGEFGGFSFPIGKQRFYPIMVAEKQICVLRAVVRGTSGHGSLKNRYSATARLAQVLRQLDRHPLPIHLTPVAKDLFQSISSNQRLPISILFRQLGCTRTAGWALRAMGERGLLFGHLLRNTANATLLRGGDQINVVPSEIELGLDGRLLPGFTPDDLISELKVILGDDVDLEVVDHDPGPPEPDMGLFDTLADVLRQADPQGIPVPMLLPGATDGRFLARLGIQSYGFLPMLLPPDFAFSETIHGPNERVPIDALEFGCEAMYQVLRRFGEGREGPSTLTPAHLWQPEIHDN